jgi:hypothetical protein
MENITADIKDKKHLCLLMASVSLIEIMIPVLYSTSLTNLKSSDNSSGTSSNTNLLDDVLMGSSVEKDISKDLIQLFKSLLNVCVECNDMNCIDQVRQLLHYVLYNIYVDVDVYIAILVLIYAYLCTYTTRF